MFPATTSAYRRVAENLEVDSVSLLSDFVNTRLKPDRMPVEAHRQMIGHIYPVLWDSGFAGEVLSEPLNDRRHATMHDQITGETDERGRLTFGTEYANRHVVATVTRSVDIDSLTTMRAVHFLNSSHYGRAQLYAGHGIDRAEAVFGVDWDTGPVWAKNEFADIENASAIKDYNAMESARDGALVAAYYGRRKKNQDADDPYNLDNSMVLGICPPDATVQAVPIEASSAPDDDDGPVFIKSLPLVDTVELTRSERPELFKRFAAGRSVYETDSREEMIREAYSERRY